MAIRNTVSIEFTVGGPGMRQLDAIAARLRGLGSVGSSLNTATAGVTRVTTAVTGLSTASAKASGAMRRIGEIAAGSFGGNVLAGIFTAAASAAANFAKESVAAALGAEQAMTQLRTQSRLTGTDLNANIALAKQVAKEFRVSDTDALGLVGSATRAAAAAGRPEDTLKFLRSAADLAAAAGRPMSELNEIVRQLGSANPEPVLDKIAGGTNPSAIFDAFAKSIGTTADKLTAAQEKLAIFSFTLNEASKVQGTAAESMNTTSGRIAQLGASYDNIQTKLGKLIVDTPIFQRTLEGLQQAAAALDTPESLAGFNKMSSALEKIARGFVIVSSSVIAFGDIMSTVWDVALTKGSRLVEELALRFQKLGNDFVLFITGLVDSLPAPIRAFAGLGGVNAAPARNAAVLGNAQVDIGLKNLAELNRQTDANGLDTIQKALVAVNQAVLGFDAVKSAGGAGVTGAAGGGVPAAAVEALMTLAGGTGGAAGAFAGDFRLVTRGGETGDGLTLTRAFERVSQTQVKASNDLAAKTAALTTIMEEVQNNPAFARVEFVAGENTLIKSVVPTGGAGRP